MLKCGKIGRTTNKADAEHAFWEAECSDAEQCTSGSGGQILLWRFLLDLLMDKANKKIITWTGDGWEFKLKDPEEVARRWGKRKNFPTMNYEKMSRGLRYYYEKDIMEKSFHKKFGYRYVNDLESELGKTAEEVHKMVDLKPEDVEDDDDKDDDDDC